MRRSTPGLPTWKRIIAKEDSGMALSRVEKERIEDSRLKLQAVARSLKEVNRQYVPDFPDIEECIEDADESLGTALSQEKNR